MIVQHTDKECKTKFSIGVEFKNSLYGVESRCNRNLINFHNNATITANKCKEMCDENIYDCCRSKWCRKK